MGEILLVLKDIRSAHNVGSLLRTADGLGVSKVILAGYTPYPTSKNDSRLPHIAGRTDAKIHKTALGAEKTVSWEYTESLAGMIDELKKSGYEVAALEQSGSSQPIDRYHPAGKVALIVGSEIDGLDPAILSAADVILEIPMRGAKESFNVSVAAAMALYHLTMLDRPDA